MNLQIIRHLVARITRWYLAIDLRYSFHVICVEVRIATKLIYLFECSTNCGRHKKRNSSLVDLYLSILDQSITVLVFAKMVEHWKKYEKKAEKVFFIFFFNSYVHFIMILSRSTIEIRYLM